MTINDVARVDALAHLARLDAAAPGLVVGLHVYGSAVLDDYRPGVSDLDLVAEVTHPLDAADLAAVATAHQGDGLRVETVYLPVGTLGTPNGPAPWVREGEAHPEPSGDLQPVALLQLARDATTLRGERPAIEADVAAAQDYCRDNLAGYWAPLVQRLASVLAERAPDAPCDPVGAMWLGLGPTRLWHTIRTGEIVSKTRAGTLAAEHWPDLAPDLLDLVAARAGSPVTLTTRHGLAAVASGRRVIAETNR
jgi:streptomycin 3"-adenylyltransferase